MRSRFISSLFAAVCAVSLATTPVAQPSCLAADDAFSDHSQSFDKFFVFRDPPTDKYKRSKLETLLELHHLEKWTPEDSQIIQKMLDEFVVRNAALMPYITSGVPIQLVRASDSLSVNTDQNVDVAQNTIMKEDTHCIVVSSEFIAIARGNKPEENLFLMTHEIGHIADPHGLLSLEASWLKRENPKLLQFKKLFEACKQKNNANVRRALAKKCLLVSPYAASNLLEDFADTFATALCEPTKIIDPKSTAVVLNLIRTKKLKVREHFVASDLARLNDDNATALAEINKAIAMDPDSPDLFREREHIRHATETEAQVEEYSKDLMEDLLRATKLYAASGALPTENNYRDAQECLAHAYGQQKKFVEQKVLLLKLLKDRPHNPYLLREMSIHYEDQNLHAQALPWATKAIEFGELDEQNWGQRARVRLNAGDYKGALADFTLSLLIKPNDTWALYHKGACYYFLGQYGSARSEVAKALELDPKDYHSANAISWADFKMGNYKLSIEECDKAISLKPSPMATATKGYCLLQLKRYDESEKFLKEALRAKLPSPGDTSDAYMNLGEVQMNLGRYDEAIASEKLGMKASPKNSYGAELLKKILKKKNAQK